MQWLKDISIKYKIFGVFLIIWLFGVLFSIYLVTTFNRFSQLIKTLDTEADKRTLIVTISNNTNQLSNAIKSYLLTKNPKWEKTYDATSSQLQENLSKYTVNNDRKNEVRDFTDLKETISKIQGIELLILTKTKEGDTASAIKLFDTYDETQEEHVTVLGNALVIYADNDFDTTLTNYNDALNRTVFIYNVSVLILLIFSIINGYYFSAFVQRKITELLAIVNKIAAGDLSTRVRISSKDEIGRLAAAFNSMTDQLQQSYNTLEGKVVEKTKELSETVSVLGQEKTKDEAILDSVGDGMIVSDNNGKILMLNHVAKTLLALEDKVFANKTTSDLFELTTADGTPVPHEKHPITISLQTGKKASDTFNFAIKDKKSLVLGLTATPVIEQGKIIGAVELIRDITKEKEVDRMKTEFISLASHQLRTPLSAIKWFSEMLVGGDAGQLTDEQKDFAQNISDSTERMIELVNSLLNISRIESGRILIDPKPTDLKGLVDELVNELQVKIQQKQQSLVVSVHADLPTIKLDPKLIRQVYMNLLTNSIKYTPKGGEISVFISKKDDQIVSQVTDNGYGIPKTQQDKIFQKFFRAENIIKVETDGTGLGLYLIKAIIESSNGKIWFTSEEGKGTSFFFSLPMSGMLAKKGEVTLDE